MSEQVVPIEVRWEATCRAATEALLGWLGWRAWIIRVVGLVLASWVVGTAGGVGPMVAGLVEGLVLVTLPEWTAAVSWSMSRRLGRRFVNVIDATGVARRSELNSWFYSWQSFSRVRRTRRHWILRAGRTLIVLPVSELSPAEERQFREYLDAAGLS
jgi:hypothetical protein